MFEKHKHAEVYSGFDGGAFKQALAIWKEDGLKGFWKGFSAC
jgi:hypothetical protein